MRIGINLLYLLPYPVIGTGTYAAGLLAGLARVAPDAQFCVFLNRESASWPLPTSRNFIRVHCPVSASSRASRYFFEQFGLPRLLRAHAVDLVHSLGYVSPLLTPCPSVVTVPDLNYRAFGQAMPLVRRLALSRFIYYSVRRAHAVIAISDYCRREILSAFRVSPQKVAVTHLAPREREEASLAGSELQNLYHRLGITPPFLLAFGGGWSPHKNVPRLLQAFARARAKYHIPHQLALIGPPPDSGPCDDLLEQPELRSAVRFIGNLDDRSLKSVLSGAELFVLPSLYEGFGLPILEAMALGVPVVCSTAASLPEVGGNAAIYFDPLSVDDMAEKIGRVALDTALRERLKHLGAQNVQRFSWERTAQQTLEVYWSILRAQKTG